MRAAHLAGSSAAGTSHCPPGRVNGREEGVALQVSLDLGEVNDPAAWGCHGLSVHLAASNHKQVIHLQQRLSW